MKNIVIKNLYKQAIEFINTTIPNQTNKHKNRNKASLIFF